MAQYNEGYDQGGQLWKTWYMMSRRGQVAARHRAGSPDGSIKVVRDQDHESAAYEYERIYPNHGGVVDMQLNHASNWDCPDAYLYPNPA